MEKEKYVTITFTVEEAEELLHSTITSYMDYDENRYSDPVLQDRYNQSVYQYNTKIDDLRLKIKKALEDEITQ